MPVQRDRRACAILQTSTIPSSRIRSKCRSFVIKMACSWRHVAAWITSATSGVVTYLALNLTYRGATRTRRARSKKALASHVAVSDRNASAYRRSSSAQCSLPTSATSSVRSRVMRKRSVAVSRRGCLIAATKAFVSTKNARVGFPDAGIHVLPDLARERLHIRAVEFPFQTGRNLVDVQFHEHHPAVPTARNQQLRPIVNPGGLPNGPRDHDSTRFVDRDDLRHGSVVVMVFPHLVFSMGLCHISRCGPSAGQRTCTAAEPQGKTILCNTTGRRSRFLAMPATLCRSIIGADQVCVCWLDQY